MQIIMTMLCRFRLFSGGSDPTLTRASSPIAIQPISTVAATLKCSSRVGADLATTTITDGTLINIWKCKVLDNHYILCITLK